MPPVPPVWQRQQGMGLPTAAHPQGSHGQHGLPTALGPLGGGALAPWPLPCHLLRGPNRVEPYLRRRL